MHPALRTAATFVCLLLLAAGAVTTVHAQAVQVGIVTDVHAHDADSPPEGKVMQNYGERLGVFVDAMNTWPADAILNLGDLANGNFVMGALGDPARIPGILEDAVSILSGFDGPIYHVVGNHDLYDLDKTTYLDIVGAETTYFSFDLGGFHFVVLDAEYNDPDESDYDHVFMRVKCRIPAHELDWLQADLADTPFPTIVCIHQPLDSDFDANAGGPAVVNNAQVRDLLRESGVVVAVFQGHDHDNRYAKLDGIHYVTFAAMVDHTDPAPPTWAQVTLDPVSRTISIDGHGLQASWELTY